MKKLYIASLLWTLSFSAVFASPTFYFDESDSTIIGNTHSVELFIDTDGSTITAAQTIITIPTAVLTYSSALFSDYPWPEYETGEKPNCTHSLLPPDWSLPYKSSPYTQDNKFYVACGFPGGYTTQGSSGDKIASINFLAEEVGTASFSFDSSNTKFYYIGSLLTSGAMSDYSVTVSAAVEPTPAPGEIPDKATDSISESDLNFVEVGQLGTTSQTSVSQSSGEEASLEVVEEDNTIPSAPDLPERDGLVSLLQRASQNNNEQEETSDRGEVLASQSLRELLIPGNLLPTRQLC